MLTDGPTTLQELMSVDMGDFAMAHLGDILIFIPTLEEHTKHSQKVHDHLQQHDFNLKLLIY